MHRLSALAAVLAAALAACGSDMSNGRGAESPAARGVGELDALHHQSLATLRDLEVFEVGQLVTDLPENAFHCYGLCPEYLDEYSAAVDRLAGFADLAAAAAAAADRAACDLGRVEGDLATLADLEVVEVGAFLAAAPENNPNCYNQPCAEDIEAAEATTCERAARLGAIAAAVRAR